MRYDPLIILSTLVLACCYLAGLIALSRTKTHWPAVRTCSFAAGLVTVVLTTIGWSGSHVHELFWVYTLQINTLLIVSPVLLVLGRPHELYTAATNRSKPDDSQAGTFFQRGPLGVLMHPAVAPLLIPAVLGAAFFTPVMNVTLTNSACYELGHVILIVLGLAFAAAFTTPRPHETTALVMVAIAAGFVEFLVDGVPGFVIRISDQVLIPHFYLIHHRSHGPSYLNDQHLGGALMWGLADSADAPFIALLLTRWIRADTRESGESPNYRSYQEELDATPETTGPWWEAELDSYASRRAAMLRKGRPTP